MEHTGEKMGRIHRAMILALAAIAVLGLTVKPVHAASAAKIDKEVTAALKKLYAVNRTAKLIGENAKAALVFPSIWKAGFIVGGQGGNGALRKGGKSIGYYNSAAASYGLQAGVQAFGYALFLMTDRALEYLYESDGWELGVGPTIVVVNAGAAKNLTTTTLNDDVYAFTFDQTGLMAGLAIEGAKISQIDR